MAAKALEALRPLELLTADGASVLLLHHPKKGDVLAGQAARGSGALCAYADVLLELHWAVRDNREDRRRRLSAGRGTMRLPPAASSSYRPMAATTPWWKIRRTTTPVRVLSC
jgi:hypothetical protein